MTKRPETILVVDDNEDDVILLMHALRKAGVINPVQILNNGTDAIEYLEGAGEYADRSRFPYPGFLLLDLHLPLQSGFEVLDWLKRNPQPDLKAVVCTGTAGPAEIERAYELGAEIVVQKTADFSRFVQEFQAIPGMHQVFHPEGIELACA